MGDDAALAFTLQLMRARYLPELPPCNTSSVLILGMGTLGCALSRNLLPWGITTLTLVDHGVVRAANPTRQCLYTVADVGCPKAAAAAGALRALSPAARITPHALSIPTPGRGSVDLDALEHLQGLITQADVVFLCTDTRESRWCPAFLCTLCRTPCIALGLTFDSYLVIRSAPRSSCYFCADTCCFPSAPAVPLPPSETCTLTRPGLAAMCAAAAAELMAALLCHRQGLQAPAEDGRGGSGSGGSSSSSIGPLGPTYNVLRHCLPTHTITLATLPGSPTCTACSPAVLEGGIPFLMQVLTADGAGALQGLLAQRMAGSSSSSNAGGAPADPATAAPAEGGAAGGGGGAAASASGGGGGAAASASDEAAAGWMHV